MLSNLSIKVTTRASQATRFKIGDAVIVKNHAPNTLGGRRGVIIDTAIPLACQVSFEELRHPVTGYVLSHWLEATT